MPTETFLDFFPYLYRMGSNSPFVLIQYGQPDQRWIAMYYGILPTELGLRFHGTHKFEINSSTMLVVAGRKPGEDAQADNRTRVYRAELDISCFKYAYDLSNLDEVHTLLVGRDLYQWHKKLMSGKETYAFDDLAGPLHAQALDILPEGFIGRARDSMRVYA